MTSVTCTESKVGMQSGEDGLVADDDDTAVWGSSTSHSHR